MKSKNLLIAALLASTSVQAKTWNEYRMEILGQEDNQYSQNDAVERAARIIKLMNQKDVESKKFTESLNAVEMKAASIVENRVRSSEFMKSVMQPAILAIHEDHLRGAPLAFNPSDFESETQIKNEDRRYGMCVKAIGEAGMDRVLNNFLNLVIKLDSDERNVKSVLVEKASEVSDAAKSVALKVQKYINANIPSLNVTLGHVFGVKVIDGVVRNIYFTQRNDVTIQNPKTLPESEMSNVTLSMLAGFRSGEDYAFIASHDCLLRKIDSETAKLQKEIEEMSTGRTAMIKRSWYDKDIQNSRVRLNDLERMKNYLTAKKLGAQTVGQRLNKMGSDVEKLLTLFIRIQGSNLPIANEMSVMQVAIVKMNDASTTELTQAERDFSHYQSMHRELDRLEEFLRQEVGHKAVINQSIERMKELK